jgi:hypothetical protein
MLMPFMLTAGTTPEVAVFVKFKFRKVTPLELLVPKLRAPVVVLADTTTWF